MSPTSPPYGWVVPAAIVAALLAAALAVGASPGLAALDGGQHPAVVTQADAPGYLQPGGDGQSRQQIGGADVDVSVAVTDGAHALHGQFERDVFEARYGAAETATERTRLIRRQVEELDGRVESILVARDAAVAAHSRGDLGSAQFVRTLVRVDAASTRAERLRGLVLDRSRTSGSTSGSFQTSLGELEVDLASVRGPATEQTREAVVGRSGVETAYVKTVDDHGLVVATVQDGEFRRDALDSDRWQPGVDNFASGDELGFAAAYRRAEELYPWTFGANVAPGPATPYVNTSVYSITADHTQGQLVTYLDGTTEDVFREVHRQRLAAVPVDSLGVESGDGLRVSVNGTHETGPMNVRVTDAESGEPVDSEVLIDGVRVGATGADGQLWTVQPDGGFTVNATSGEESVELTVL